MYLHWEMSENQPSGNFSYEGGGVDGMGIDWVQPFVKGLYLGLKHDNPDSQVWVRIGNDDVTGGWIKIEELLDFDSVNPQIQP